MRDASRAHPATAVQAHGAAQSARPPADDQAEDLRRADAPAPGPAAARTQARPDVEPQPWTGLDRSVTDWPRLEINRGRSKTKKTFYLGHRPPQDLRRPRPHDRGHRQDHHQRPRRSKTTSPRSRTATPSTARWTLTDMRNRARRDRATSTAAAITGQAGAVCQGWPAP